MNSVRYSKDLKSHARKTNLHLFTIDITGPGARESITLQAPCDTEFYAKIKALIHEFQSKGKK